MKKTSKEQIEVNKKIDRFNEMRNERDTEFIKTIQSKLTTEELNEFVKYFNVVPEIEMFEGVMMSVKPFQIMKDEVRLKGQPIEVFALEKRAREFASDYIFNRLQALTLPVTHTEVEVEEEAEDETGI